MAKEKKKKLNILSCKCEVKDRSPGEASIHKNCKCFTSGRKERFYNSLLIVEEG